MGSKNTQKRETKNPKKQPAGGKRPHETNQAYSVKIGRPEPAGG